MDIQTDRHTHGNRLPGQNNFKKPGMCRILAGVCLVILFAKGSFVKYSYCRVSKVFINRLATYKYFKWRFTNFLLSQLKGNVVSARELLSSNHFLLIELQGPLDEFCKRLTSEDGLILLVYVIYAY